MLLWFTVPLSLFFLRSTNLFVLLTLHLAACGRRFSLSLPFFTTSCLCFSTVGLLHGHRMCLLRMLAWAATGWLRQSGMLTACETSAGCASVGASRCAGRVRAQPRSRSLASSWMPIGSCPRRDLKVSQWIAASRRSAALCFLTHGGRCTHTAVLRTRRTYTFLRHGRTSLGYVVSTGFRIGRARGFFLYWTT